MEKFEKVTITILNSLRIFVPWRMSVDGRPNRRQKATSGAVWTGSERNLRENASSGCTLFNELIFLMVSRVYITFKSFICT